MVLLKLLGLTYLFITSNFLESFQFSSSERDNIAYRLFVKQSYVIKSQYYDNSDFGFNAGKLRPNSMFNQDRNVYHIRI